jgi:hypothetical protein
MSFVVDGSEWQFDGVSLNVISTSIDGILDFVEISRKREERIWVGDDLQTRTMLGGEDLWSIASSSGALGLLPEVAQELAAWLGSAPRYADGEWPDGMETDLEIAVADAPVVSAPDLAWAHHSVRARKPVACLSLFRSGMFVTRSAAGSANVFWVKTEEDRVSFWRNAIILDGDSADSLDRFASQAYPRIYFCRGALGGKAKLGGGYLAVRSVVQRCLASLSDHGEWAFTFPRPALRPNEPMGPDPTARPTRKIIEDRFRGLGIEIAPENPDVFKDPVCRRAREVLVRGKLLYCEWHIKIELHRNRIHVHAPVAETDNKVAVAIIDEHLPLP